MHRYNIRTTVIEVRVLQCIINAQVKIGLKDVQSALKLIKDLQTRSLAFAQKNNSLKADIINSLFMVLALRFSFNLYLYALLKLTVHFYRS